MQDINILNEAKLYQIKFDELRGFFDYSGKEVRLKQINAELQTPQVWQDPKLSQNLSKEKSTIESTLVELDAIQADLDCVIELYPVAQDEGDLNQMTEMAEDLKQIISKIEQLELRRMFDNPNDKNNAYLEIQAGSGGTEAQDWAEMLQRMYLRWADEKNYKAKVIDNSPGEVAGIKSTTISVQGNFSYGWLRTETGVHRLVRKSPFDSGNRRHTSFASVFVTAEIDDNVNVDINPSDLRIDTYRSSGAGGQHVNTTDSAIRITHLPSGVVVQCQSDRSQHKNKAQAMKQLRAKLFQLEIEKRSSDKKKLESEKSDISWGSQIRSYVLDDSRIKDLRTGVECSNTQSVLDGNIDQFLIACLKQTSGDNK
ncbi:MAG: peptide chain release factor 2 [Pseudomonadota bacterium]|nr:peptide chain release factor 2 [Pseudomonadota bacterium]